MNQKNRLEGLGDGRGICCYVCGSEGRVCFGALNGNNRQVFLLKDVGGSLAYAFLKEAAIGYEKCEYYLEPVEPDEDDSEGYIDDEPTQTVPKRDQRSPFNFNPNGSDDLGLQPKNGNERGEQSVETVLKLLRKFPKLFFNIRKIPNDSFEDRKGIDVSITLPDIFCSLLNNNLTINMQVKSSLNGMKYFMIKGAQIEQKANGKNGRTNKKTVWFDRHLILVDGSITSEPTLMALILYQIWLLILETDKVNDGGNSRKEFLYILSQYPCEYTRKNGTVPINNLAQLFLEYEEDIKRTYQDYFYFHQTGELTDEFIAINGVRMKVDGQSESNGNNGNHGNNGKGNGRKNGHSSNVRPNHGRSF